MTRIAARSRTRAAGLVALFVISATALTFRSVGSHALKGFETPVELFAVGEGT